MIIRITTGTANIGMVTPSGLLPKFLDATQTNLPTADVITATTTTTNIMSGNDQSTSIRSETKASRLDRTRLTITKK